MWSDFRQKSPEEVAKEKEEQSRREKELQEKSDRLRKELDSLIKKYDDAEDMKFALEHLKEPDVIAKHVNSNSENYLHTFWRLCGLIESLKGRAEVVDMKASIDREPDDSSDRLKALRPILQVQIPNLPPASPRSATLPSKEGNELRELARLLNKQADYYFNNRKELGDDDPNATPLTLFTVRRVTNFLPQLFDDKERLAYLLKLKNSFLRQDEKGRVLVNGIHSFRADKDFQLQLENLINTYREITSIQGEAQGESTQPLITSKMNREFTTKRKVLAIDYMLRHLGIKNVTKKTRADFIQFLIDRNHKEITNSLDDSTLLSERNGTTAEFLRNWFEKLGLSEIVKDIESNATFTKKK